MNKIIKIGNRIVGEGQPVFIIAEAGVNHNGNYKLAEKLVRESKKAGADCVKFQTYKTERIVTAKSPKAAYQMLSTDPKESQATMLKALELPEKDYFRLKKLARSLGIVFISTPYNFEDIDFLDQLGVPAFKLASIHLTELPTVKYVAEKGRPVILSTGMGTLLEVKEAARVFRATNNENLILLQCTTNYPSDMKDLNLNAIATIAKATGAVVGYSDHCMGIEASVVAVAAGAKVIEKHFTLDKKMKGPDHSSSADPKEFKEMVRRIREVEMMLGSSVKKPTAVEQVNRKGMKRSLTASVFIKKSQKIKSNMIGFKRPEGGLSPNFYDKIIGKKAKRDIAKDQILTQRDI